MGGLVGNGMNYTCAVCEGQQGRGVVNYCHEGMRYIC